MISPNWQGSPSRYEPNPIDDRAVKGPASSVYLALATAIEQIEVIRDTRRTTNLRLDPGTIRAINSAESALRRAAFGVVLHSEE
jgi:hypothetical protein